MSDPTEVLEPTDQHGSNVSRRSLLAKSVMAGAVGVIAHFLPSPIGGYPPVAEADPCVSYPCYVIATECYCGPDPPNTDYHAVQCCSGYGDFGGAITVVDLVYCPGAGYYTCAACCLGSCGPCTNWYIGENCDGGYRCS